MGVMAELCQYEVFCVIKDCNNHALEVAVDRRSGKVRLIGHEGFQIELSPCRAMWLANVIIKYCPFFSKKIIPDSLYSLIRKIK
jgi:hypothetical protein